MTYRLISLSGLIHDYQGEAKEYPKKDEYTGREMTHHKTGRIIETDTKAFESQCVLVEDQLIAENLIINSNPIRYIHIQDRTLYTVEAPEMEKVEQCSFGNDNWMDSVFNSTLFHPEIKLRTVMRFKEVKEKVSPINDEVRKAYLPEDKESQEELWHEVGGVLHDNYTYRMYPKFIRALMSKFQLTRKS